MSSSSVSSSKSSENMSFDEWVGERGGDFGGGDFLGGDNGVILGESGPTHWTKSEAAAASSSSSEC